MTYRKEIKWTPEYNRQQMRLRAARPEVKAARVVRRLTKVGIAPFERSESLDSFEAFCQRQEDRVRKVVSTVESGVMTTVDPISAPEMYDYEKR